MNSVELFTGAGGLALGITKAGFRHLAVLEKDSFSCDTVRENQRRGFNLVGHWNLVPGDVAEFNYSSIEEDVDLVAGGPPCQPFSIGGKHRGPADKRDMFPQMIRAVRALQPKAVLIENVRGLLRKSFSGYFEYVFLQLSYPEVERKPNEEIAKHKKRLEQHHTGGSELGLRYKVVFDVLNAAEYGVPQKRDRVFIVAVRADLGIEWSFPEPTHSLNALLREQWVSDEYWDRHRVARRDRPELPVRLKPRVDRLRNERLPFQDCEFPMRTVRDAISDLPDPEKARARAVFPNHAFIRGARSYVGHTGSPLDEPAKVLKAGDHGVPGGENMLQLPDGRVRYFTVREAARLQTFPDDYVFHGSWSETMRQLGNAVPVDLAEQVAGGLKEKLATL